MIERRDFSKRSTYFPNDDISRATALYLADMIGQLEAIARASELELLTYLLSMARTEAENNVADRHFGASARDIRA